MNDAFYFFFPTASLGAIKQINHSQHSSTSQPDDSSPYARVRSSSHAYDKVRPAEEHPYAQIVKLTDENENRPTTSNNNLNAANNNRTDGESSSSRESLRDTVDSASHQVCSCPCSCKNRTLSCYEFNLIRGKP